MDDDKDNDATDPKLISATCTISPGSAPSKTPAVVSFSRSAESVAPCHLPACG